MTTKDKWRSLQAVPDWVGAHKIMGLKASIFAVIAEDAGLQRLSTRCCQERERVKIMFVKQIDLQEALRLAHKGQEVKIPVPHPTGDWKNIQPTTLQDMLEGCLFFRQEPAMEKSGFEGAFRAAEAVLPVPVSGPTNPPMPAEPSPPLTLMEQLQNLPEAPRNRPAEVWVPVPNGRR